MDDCTADRLRRQWRTRELSPAPCRSAPPRFGFCWSNSAGRPRAWARRLVFLNGHGGNVEALAGASALLRYEGRDVGGSRAVSRTPRPAHAGHTETSVLLHISPDVVRQTPRTAPRTAPGTPRAGPRPPRRRAARGRGTRAPVRPGRSITRVYRQVFRWISRFTPSATRWAWAMSSAAPAVPVPGRPRPRAGGTRRGAYAVSRSSSTLTKNPEPARVALAAGPAPD